MNLALWIVTALPAAAFLVAAFKKLILPAALDTAPRGAGSAPTGRAGRDSTSPAGTDVVLGLEGRTAISDDGDLRTPGAFGDLPAGEAYIAPIEMSADGVIVLGRVHAGGMTTHRAP